MGERLIRVTTTGSAGNATGATTCEPPIDGSVQGIYLDYSASAPNTTVVTITEEGEQGLTLLTVTGNTDGYYPIRVQAVTTAGVAISGVYVPYYLSHRKVIVTVTLCDQITVTPAVIARVITAAGRS